MRKILALMVVVVGLGLMPTLSNAGSTKPFTATAVQKMQDKEVQGGKIFVSAQGTRFEFSEYGRDLVQIILPKQKIMRILFPKDKVYMEMPAPADTLVISSNSNSPCPPITAMTCKKLGVDKFGEMNVERWSQSIQGLRGESTLWWDPERKMIMRQEYPDGRIMQLQLAGKEDLGGRKTERWDISYAQPGRPVLTGLRMVDTDLGIIVKEQLPSGLVRELRDLKAAKVDPKWFAVPKDYKRIETPKAAPAPQQ